MVASRCRKNKRLYIEQEGLLKEASRRNISRIIAERHNGHIYFASTDGGAPLRFGVKLGIIENLDPQRSGGVLFD